MAGTVGRIVVRAAVTVVIDAEKPPVRQFHPTGIAEVAKGGETVVVEFQDMYKVDAPYSVADDAGIAWNDPDIAVDWPVTDPILSDKDKVQPRLRQFESPFSFAS